MVRPKQQLQILTSNPVQVRLQIRFGEEEFICFVCQQSIVNKTNKLCLKIDSGQLDIVVLTEPQFGQYNS
jgi:hypothetical protein